MQQAQAVWRNGGGSDSPSDVVSGNRQLQFELCAVESATSLSRGRRTLSESGRDVVNDDIKY